eukprot:21631-Alexandrium_andersonii.AAC.1
MWKMLEPPAGLQGGTSLPCARNRRKLATARFRFCTPGVPRFARPLRNTTEGVADFLTSAEQGRFAPRT